MSDPTTRAELLEKMQSSYAMFEALLAPLSETQLTTPGVNGEWTIKDILAHIMIWQKRMIVRLEAVVRNEEPRLQPAINTEEEMHQFNADTFVSNRSRPLGEIQADFRASARQLLTSVEAVSENDLFNPQRFAWMDGEPLWKNVGGNSFWHYEEHAPMIEEWLALQKA